MQLKSKQSIALRRIPWAECHFLIDKGLVIGRNIFYVYLIMAFSVKVGRAAVSTFVYRQIKNQVASFQHLVSINHRPGTRNSRPAARNPQRGSFLPIHKRTFKHRNQLPDFKWKGFSVAADKKPPRSQAIQNRD